VGWATSRRQIIFRLPRCAIRKTIWRLRTFTTDLAQPAVYFADAVLKHQRQRRAIHSPSPRFFASAQMAATSRRQIIFRLLRCSIRKTIWRLRTFIPDLAQPAVYCADAALKHQRQRRAIHSPDPRCLPAHRWPRPRATR